METSSDPNDKTVDVLGSTEKGTKVDSKNTNSKKESTKKKKEKNPESNLKKIEKKKRLLKNDKAGLNFPVTRIARFLKSGKFCDRIGASAPIFLAAVLEYLTAEVLELAGQSAKEVGKTRIIPRHIQRAIRGDDELNQLLSEAIIAAAGVLPHIHSIMTKEAAQKLNKISPSGGLSSSPSSTPMDSS